MSLCFCGMASHLRWAAGVTLMGLLCGCIVIERVPPEGEVPPEAMAGQGTSAAAAEQSPSAGTTGTGSSATAVTGSAEVPSKPVSPWSNELSQAEMRAPQPDAPPPPSPAPPPPPAAPLPPEGPTTSFGAGAELERRVEAPLEAPPGSPATAPSFGQGAELYRAEPGEHLPPPPQARALPLRPGLLPPVQQTPPPTSATEQLARTLLADVEDLREVTLSRRILPRTQVRIDSISTRGHELRLLTVGDPRLEPLAIAIEGHFNALQISARQHDRVGMMASINALSTRLRELQILLAARP